MDAMTEEELLNQLHGAISSGEALASLMRMAAEGARSLFYGHAATIYFFDEKEQLLVPQNWNLPEGLTSKIEKLLGFEVRGLRLPVIKAGLYWRSMHERRAFLLTTQQEITGLIAELASDHPAAKKFVPMIVRLLGYRTVLIAPLVTADEVIGVIDVGSKKELGNKDLERFKRLAGTLSVAITNARLLEKVQTARKEAETARNLLAGVFERITDGVVALDKDWHYTYVNRRAALMLNRDKPEDLLGKHIWTEYPEGVGQPFYKAFYKAMETQKPVYLEEYYEPWDRWFENRIYPSPDGLTIYFTETTERVQAREKQRKTDRALKALSECNQMVVRVGQESDLLSELCRIVVDVGGYKAAWIGFAEDDERKTVRPVAQAGLAEGDLDPEAVTWDDTELGRGPTGTAIRTNTVRIAQNVLTDPEFAPWREDATKLGYASLLALPLHVNGHVLGALSIFASEPDAFDADELKLLMELSGDLSYAISVLRTRAEREKVQAALRDNERLLNSILDSIQDGISVLDTDLTIRHTNAVMEKWYAANLPLRGKKCYACYHNREIPCDPCPTLRCIKSGKTERDVLPGPKGSPIEWLELFSYPMKDPQSGKVTGVVEFVRDITERVRIEHELRKTSERLELAMDAGEHGFWDWNLDTGDVYFSPRYYTMLGYEPGELPMRLETWADLMHPKDRETIVPQVQQYVERAEPYSVEFRLKCKDGSWKWISGRGKTYEKDENGVPHRAVGVHVDISERKRAEEEKRALQAELLQAQKLESIGTMASGVAHEINNPLTGMINYADLIVERVKDDELRKFAQGIMKEGNRVAEIIKDLLYFARQEKQSHSPARMEDIIDSSLTLVGATMRKYQIAIEKDIQSDLPQVRCRSQQIEQVVINLLTNARDALNQRYEGYHEDKLIKLTVRTLEKDGVEWIRTTVEDHGIGIPKDVIDRIFDPFFTTKPRDVGTGLGLSVSYGIVKEHHGELTVESEPGKYTRFHLDLRVDNGWSLG